MLDMQALIRALSRAWAKTGKRIAARMAMIAITTSSSISVKAGFRTRGIRDLLAPCQGHSFLLVWITCHDRGPLGWRLLTDLHRYIRSTGSNSCQVCSRAERKGRLMRH